ncbi:hypothetical protein AB0T83_20390, partial [Fluviibacterium sp. DFM31]
KGTFEKFFGLLVTGFDAGIELLEHASSVSRGSEYAAKAGLIENSSCRMVVGLFCHWQIRTLLERGLPAKRSVVRQKFRI